MNVLFLHQNFPAQFVHLVLALKQQGRHDLRAVVPVSNARPRLVETRTYRFDEANTGSTVPIAAHFAHRGRRGLAVASALRELRADGFTPDLVVGHPGWGETLFVHDVWSRVPVLAHAEFWYAATGADADFDPEFRASLSPTYAEDVRVRNAIMALALLDATRGVAPTLWQANGFPPELRAKIAVAHEGIDSDRITPNPNAIVRLKRDGIVLRPGDEVVTFVNRNLEPHRGFHTFMRCLPAVLDARPDARIIIVGGDDVSYGRPPPEGGAWRKIMLRELHGRLDMSRIHFVSRVPNPALVQLLQVSAAHVYLTYPFVLSWSMLDAMSAGALVIGSRTPPVEEVIEHGRNGILVDFFQPDALASAIVAVLRRPGDYRSVRAAARRTILERYDLKRVCLPAWLELTETVADRPTVSAAR